MQLADIRELPQSGTVAAQFAPLPDSQQTCRELLDRMRYVDLSTSHGSGHGNDDFADVAVANARSDEFIRIEFGVI